MSKLKFLKNSIIYFVGDFLSKIVTFLLLPVYSKYLVPEDFGYFDLVNSYIMILIPMLTLEIWAGMMRFIAEENKDVGINSIISNGMFTLIVPGIFMVVFSALNFFYFDIGYFGYIVVYAMVYLLQKYYIFICRSVASNKTFAVSGLINTLVAGLSNYYMIVSLGMGLNSLFIAAILGLSSQIIFIELRIALRKRLYFHYLEANKIKALLKFSFPLCVGSLLYYLINFYDKQVLESMVGLEANGFYAMASKFTMAIVFITGAFTMAWQDISFMRGDDQSNYEYFTRVCDMYIKVVFIGSGVLICILFFVFPIIVDAKYEASYLLLPLSIIATVLATTGNFISQTLGALKKTNVILYSSIFSTLFNIVFAHYFISSYGANGVNILLIITFLLNLLYRMIYLKFIYKMNFNIFLMAILLFFLLLITKAFYDKNVALIYTALAISSISFIILFKVSIVSLYEKMLYVLKK